MFPFKKNTKRMSPLRCFRWIGKPKMHAHYNTLCPHFDFKHQLKCIHYTFLFPTKVKNFPLFPLPYPHKLPSNSNILMVISVNSLKTKLFNTFEFHRLLFTYYYYFIFISLPVFERLFSVWFQNLFLRLYQYGTLTVQKLFSL